MKGNAPGPSHSYILNLGSLWGERGMPVIRESLQVSILARRDEAENIEQICIFKMQ